MASSYYSSATLPNRHLHSQHLSNNFPPPQKPVPSHQNYYCSLPRLASARQQYLRRLETPEPMIPVSATLPPPPLPQQRITSPIPTYQASTFAPSNYGTLPIRRRTSMKGPPPRPMKSSSTTGMGQVISWLRNTKDKLTGSSKKRSPDHPAVSLPARPAQGILKKVPQNRRSVDYASLVGSLPRNDGCRFEMRQKAPSRMGHAADQRAAYCQQRHSTACIPINDYGTLRSGIYQLSTDFVDEGRQQHGTASKYDYDYRYAPRNGRSRERAADVDWDYGEQRRDPGRQVAPAPALYYEPPVDYSCSSDEVTSRESEESGTELSDYRDYPSGVARYRNARTRSVPPVDNARRPPTPPRTAKPCRIPDPDYNSSDASLKTESAVTFEVEDESRSREHDAKKEGLFDNDNTETTSPPDSLLDESTEVDFEHPSVQSTLPPISEMALHDPLNPANNVLVVKNIQIDYQCMLIATDEIVVHFTFRLIDPESGKPDNRIVKKGVLANMTYGPGIVQKLREKFSQMAVAAIEEAELSGHRKNKKFPSVDDILSDDEKRRTRSYPTPAPVAAAPATPARHPEGLPAATTASSAVPAPIKATAVQTQAQTQVQTSGAAQTQDLTRDQKLDQLLRNYSSPPEVSAPPGAYPMPKPVVLPSSGGQPRSIVEATPIGPISALRAKFESQNCLTAGQLSYRSRSVGDTGIRKSVSMGHVSSKTSLDSTSTPASRDDAEGDSISEKGTDSSIISSATSEPVTTTTNMNTNTATNGSSVPVRPHSLLLSSHEQATAVLKENARPGHTPSYVKRTLPDDGSGLSEMAQLLNRFNTIREQKAAQTGSTPENAPQQTFEAPPPGKFTDPETDTSRTTNVAPTAIVQPLLPRLTTTNVVSINVGGGLPPDSNSKTSAPPLPPRSLSGSSMADLHQRMGHLPHWEAAEDNSSQRMLSPNAPENDSASPSPTPEDTAARDVHGAPMTVVEEESEDEVAAENAMTRPSSRKTIEDDGRVVHRSDFLKSHNTGATESTDSESDEDDYAQRMESYRRNYYPSPVSNDNTPFRHSLLSLVAEEDIPELLEAMAEDEYRFVVSDYDPNMPSTSGILHKPGRPRERRKQLNGSRIKFEEKPPQVFMYLCEENAYDEDEWHEGFSITYDEYKEVVRESQERQAREHAELAKWRALMEAQYMAASTSASAETDAAGSPSSGSSSNASSPPRTIVADDDVAADETAINFGFGPTVAVKTPTPTSPPAVHHHPTPVATVDSS